MNHSVDAQYRISAEELTHVYAHGETEVIGLQNISFNIPSGSLVVIKGNSGSGKSTLLSLIAGLDRPTSGRLIVSGWNLTEVSSKKLTQFRRQVVGMVFQSFNLLPTLNVFENVCLPAVLAGKPRRQVYPKAENLLRWLLLDKRFDHLPSQLSGGEMQRTAIARALINEPEIILADEPTGNLDSHNGKKVIELLSELNTIHHRTVLIATHSCIADAYATMEILLKDGGIIPTTCEI